MDRLSRREFLKMTSLGTLGAGVFLSAFEGLGLSDEKGQKVEMEHRTLGKTGLKVSVIGFGGSRLHTAGLAPLYKAFEMGVNYIDTAPSYGKGASEQTLSEFLKEHRDEVILATKWHVGYNAKQGRYTTTKQDLIKSFEGSMSRMKVDMIDIIQIHGAGHPEQVAYDDLFEAFDELKQAGKVRFNGFTTHSNQDKVIKAAIEAGKFDVALVAYNFMMEAHPKGKDLDKALKAAREAGLGIVNMKAIAPMKGLLKQALNPGAVAQACLRWVLSKDYTCNSVPSMNTIEEVEQDIAAVSKKLSYRESEALDRFAALIDKDYCRMCGTCTESCPEGVAVSEIMRYRMYYEWYGYRDYAASLYRELPISQTFAGCTKCGKCTQSCPYGLAVLDRLEAAHSMLA